MDLTKIEKPFGLLDDETKAALKAHGGPYEMFEGDGWTEVTPGWTKIYAYRAKPLPPRKTVYPWGALDERIKWAAVDEYGSVLVSAEKPFREAGRSFWSIGWGFAFRAEFIKFERGDEPWQETLQCRPGYEGDE